MLFLSDVNCSMFLPFSVTISERNRHPSLQRTLLLQQQTSCCRHINDQPYALSYMLGPDTDTILATHEKTEGKMDTTANLKCKWICGHQDEYGNLHQKEDQRGSKRMVLEPNTHQQPEKLPERRRSSNVRSTIIHPILATTNKINVQ